MNPSVTSSQAVKDISSVWVRQRKIGTTLRENKPMMKCSSSSHDSVSSSDCCEDPSDRVEEANLSAEKK